MEISLPRREKASEVKMKIAMAKKVPRRKQVIFKKGKIMKKYCGKKQYLKLTLINVKHIIKLWSGGGVVEQMLPALTNHFLHVVIERVQEVSTHIDNPSTVTPLVPPSATTNEDEVDPSFRVTIISLFLYCLLFWKVQIL